MNPLNAGVTASIDDYGGVRIVRPEEPSEHQCDLPILDASEVHSKAVCALTDKGIGTYSLEARQKIEDEFRENRKQANENKKLLCYITPCCQRIYRPVYDSGDFGPGWWTWKRVSRIRLALWRRKKLI